MHQVSTICTDNIKVTASALAHTAKTEELVPVVSVVNDEFDALTEQNNLTNLLREFARNAAVDGDGCLYTYWDEDTETGQNAKGAIRTEVLNNTNVFFGNPTENDVQKQPYIIIRSQLPTREVKKMAKANGVADWRTIQPDDEFLSATDSAKLVDDMTTLLLTLWRDDETGTIWAYESTQDCEVTEPWDLKIALYPIVWLNWDYVKDCAYGQAMVTGVLNNQIFVNRAWAMSMLSMMKTAYPKYAIDGTRINSIDNRVGGFIKINGGDVNSAIRAIDPATISPQVAQYIQLAIEQTQECLGASKIALGDSYIDNTSAIIAQQRAAATPIELTKQNLYKAIEDLYRIYLEFMGEYYGDRDIDTSVPDKVAQAYQFVGMPVPDEIQTKFAFDSLKDHPMTLKLDVGASSYYSEIASINTLDNLFIQAKAIDIVQYLERLPDGYIPERRQLIADIKQQRQQQQMAMPQMPMPEEGGVPGSMPEGEELTEDDIKKTIPTGGGYSQLQRAINSGAAV